MCRTDRREAPGPSRGGTLGNRLLSALPPGDLGLLTPHLEQVVLPPRSVLFEPGEVVRHTHFPAAGTVISMVGVMEDGRSAELAVVGCEGAVGGVISTGGQPASSRCVTQAAGAALRLDCARLHAARQASTPLRDLLHRLSDTVLAQVMQSAACNALHGAEERACRRLLEFHDRLGSDELPLTHEQLGELLGVRRTTVTRVLGDLTTGGAIETRRGRIVIRDRRKLEAGACECRSVLRGHLALVAPELAPPSPTREALTIT